MGPLSNFRRIVLGAVAPALAPAEAPTTPAEETAPIVCRPATREEISLGLRVVLGAHGQAADDGQVIDFMQFALRRGISLADLWLAERPDDGAVLWAVLPVVSPGRTLLLLGPGHPRHRHGATTVATAEKLVETVCAHFAGRGVQLAQVLLDPSDAVSARLYESRGFGRVAELVYLQGAPRRKAVPPPLPPGFGWVPYGPEMHEQFVSLIAETYQESLDCPSLNGLRNMDDVLAGHKACGAFDSTLWLLLSEDVVGDDGARASIPRGVLLLSPMQPGDALELVYLGLTPAARGRGLGDLLMKQALATATAQGVSRLSLAVDANNAPALKLYYRHGLQRIASKLALMRVLQPTNDPAPASLAPSPTPHISPGLSTGASHVR